MEKKFISKNAWVTRSTNTTYTSSFYARFRLALIMSIFISVAYAFYNDTTVLFTMSLPLLPIVLLILITTAQINSDNGSFQPKFLIAAIVGYIWWIIVFFIANFDWHLENLSRGGVSTIIGLFTHMYIIVVIPTFIIRMIKVGVKAICIEDSNYISYIWVSGTYSVASIVRESISSDNTINLPLNVTIFFIGFLNIILIIIGIKIRRYILVQHYSQQ